MTQGNLNAATLNGLLNNGFLGGLLIDVCPKNGKESFQKQIENAVMLVDAFDPASKPNMAVIKYCGPRTWAGVSQCSGKSKEKVDKEAVCKTKILKHFTDDMKK